MESFSKQKWEDLDLSQDEIKNIGEALKKEEFRNLLVEYVKEINDPENRKQYEKEITELERERGVEVKFVHPSAGYVLKTSVDGKDKAFINICSNDNVGKPASVPDIKEGLKGLQWSLPYCLAPPREDVDKKNNTCMVFDVVFHPDTLHMSKSNTAFKKLVEDTALGAVEDAYKVSLDKINIKYPKMQFKGSKHPTVIRKKIENFQATDVTVIPNYPYPSISEESKELKPSKSIERNKTDLRHNKENVEYTIPKYSIKYRKNIDMQDFTNDPMTKFSASVPSELIIVIDLPLLKHSSDASIDVSGNSLFLISETPAKYKLNLNLPYIVDDINGNAKFDTVKKTLTVTLPVSKSKSYLVKTDSTREDSGVESDNFIGGSNSPSSSDDDGVGKDTSSSQDFEDHLRASEGYCQNEKSVDAPTDGFLKTNIHYTLPNYNCHISRDILSSTLQVSNVNPESIEYCFIEKSNLSGFCITFLSTGSGYFPVNYAFFILLPTTCKIDKETFSVEVWDNNVIAQIKLQFCNESYNGPIMCCIGSDENRLENVALPVSDFVHSQFPNKEILDKENQENKPDVNENEKWEEKKEEILKERTDVSSVETKPDFEHENSLATKRSVLKSRTMSECHQTDLGVRKHRGILKIGRSLSMSSVDDYASWSDEKEKTKKTVRFSEVITKQTFRMNSSILGQRKKNQRKLKNKRRAQERRLSESGNESEGDSESMTSMKGKDQFNCNRDVDVWYQDPDSSSCETSELSEVSDVSESDDGLKEEPKAFVPCSSKKNHKRRGKKSARKNAATAKFQFMEN